MSHFLTDRNPAFLTAPVQLNEAAELMGLVLTGEEDRSISSSEMAVVKDILSSSDICIENEANPEKKGISTPHFRSSIIIAPFNTDYNSTHSMARANLNKS
jgi:hypothetical protein